MKIFGWREDQIKCISSESLALLKGTHRWPLDSPHKRSVMRKMFSFDDVITLRWRHNDHAGVSNHQPHGCLLNRLFRHRSKKTSKLRVTGLCAGNSPGPVNYPHTGPVTRKMFPFDDVIMMLDENILMCYYLRIHNHLWRACAMQKSIYRAWYLFFSVNVNVLHPIFDHRRMIFGAYISPVVRAIACVSFLTI